jgi:hypothetical protein
MYELMININGFSVLATSDAGDLPAIDRGSIEQLLGRWQHVRDVRTGCQSQDC